jgi:hypothetical protein
MDISIFCSGTLKNPGQDVYICQPIGSIIKILNYFQLQVNKIIPKNENI